MVLVLNKICLMNTNPMGDMYDKVSRQNEKSWKNDENSGGKYKKWQKKIGVRVLAKTFKKNDTEMAFSLYETLKTINNYSL